MSLNDLRDINIRVEAVSDDDVSNEAVSYDDGNNVYSSNNNVKHNNVVTICKKN